MDRERDGGRQGRKGRTRKASDEERMGGAGFDDVAAAGEGVLLVHGVHFEREGVLHVVGLDGVPAVVAELVG